MDLLASQEELYSTELVMGKNNVFECTYFMYIYYVYIIYMYICLIKIKIKVKFTLEQATKGQRGSRGIALLFL